MTKSLLFAACLSACSIPGVSLGGHTSIGSSSPATPTAPKPASEAPAKTTAPIATTEPVEESDEVSLPNLLKAVEDTHKARRSLMHGGATEADLAFSVTASDECNREISAALKRYPGFKTVAGDSQHLTLEQIEGTCRSLEGEREGALQNRKREADRQAESDAQNRVFANAGLTGDRVTVARNGIFRGAGNTPMTLKQLAKARYVFELAGSNFDGYVLHRLAFEGDKISDDREQGFVVKPGPEAYH